MIDSRRALLLFTACLALALAASEASGAGQPSTERAQSLAREARLDEALAEYEAVLADSPGAREARLGRARVLGWLGRHGDSLAALEAMEAENPEDPEALVLQARVLGWTQRHAEAEARARRAVALAPHFVEAHLVLGDVLTWEGQREQAVTAFETALLLEPDSMEAREGLRRLAVPPPESRLHAEVGLRYDSLDGGRSDWWREDAQLAFRVDPQVTLFGGVTQFRRFDKDDTQGSLGIAWSAPRGWWLGGGLTLGPKNDVVARYAFGLELARRLDERVLLQLRYRRSWYVDDVETDAITPGVELRLFEPLKLAAHYHFTHVTGGRIGYAGSLRGEVFPESRWSGYTALSVGTEAFAPSTTAGARKRALTVSTAAGLRWRHDAGFGLRLGYAFQDLEDTYQRHGLETGVWVDF